MTAVRWLTFAGGVAIVGLFAVKAVAAQEQCHNDGVAVWCCPPEAGATCRFVRWAGEIEA